MTAAMAASAATVQYDFNIGLTNTDWTENVALARFDSSLGTLTGVKLHVDAEAMSDIWLANLQTTTGKTITGKRETYFSIFDNDASSAVNDINTGTTFDFSLVNQAGKNFEKNPAGAPIYDGVVGEKFLDLTDSNAFNFISTDNAVLSYVTGTAALSFTVDVFSQSTTTGGGNLKADYWTKAAAKGFIEYTYTPQATPEPATMAALGLGALGLLRRRKQVAK